MTTDILSQLLPRIRQFIDSEVIPLESAFLSKPWRELEPTLQAKRQMVRSAGMWGLALPPEIGGQGLTLAEFGRVSEELGRTPLGHYVFNCQAPDIGNTELLLEYGSPQQKDRWLMPLVRGEIRSCFSMTEPEHAGSNPTWMSTTAVQEGDEYVINGHKWYTTAADGAAFAIVMAVTNPNAESRHQRASQIIVPLDTPGFTLVRNIAVMGESGEGWPTHGEVTYENVRVPVSNRIGEEGAGFALAQQRLGPGRIHHCMRWIGICERAFDLMCRYAVRRELAPGRPIASQQVIQHAIAESRAEIDPQQQSARLGVTLDSGPAFRLGSLQVDGLQRYTPELVARIARLEPGSPYDQTALLEAQQRLQDSGHFNSVVLEIDPKGDPDAVPVVATVREARRSNIQLGVGVSTDSGVRLSAEHTNHQMPLLGWRAVSKLLLDNDTKSVQSEWTAPRDPGLWQWQVFGRLKNEAVASVDVRSQQLRAGRLQLGEAIDRNLYLQYDRATTTGTGVHETAQSLSANYAWTLRRFDRLPFPSGGYGLGVELGGGYTLGNQRAPFMRTRLNWLGIWSLGDAAGDRATAARAGRIALRAQAGAVLARKDAVLPSTQLFLTGGDATVRGYSFHSIGASESGGVVTPGRYLASASIEWQRPILIDGRPSEWESTVFIDAGTVADKPSAFKAKVGIGAGVRYRSPVGPLQLDLAYGLATRNLRLHLSVGFTF